MIDRLKRWNRERLFIKAYMILRKESDRHRRAGHVVHFEATGPDHISLVCVKCPDMHPDSKSKVV